MDWKNSADYLELSICKFINNVATYGAAISVQSFPSYQVRNSTMNRVIFGPNNGFYVKVSATELGRMQQLMNNFTWTRSYLFFMEVQEGVNNISASLDVQLSIMKRVNFDVQYRVKLESTGNALVYLKSARVAVKGEQAFVCMGEVQGMFAVDSVLFQDSGANMTFYLCVATHGGAMALYSDSTIVLSDGVQLSFIQTMLSSMAVQSMLMKAMGHAHQYKTASCSITSKNIQHSHLSYGKMCRSLSLTIQQDRKATLYTSLMH